MRRAPKEQESTDDPYATHGIKYFARASSFTILTSPSQIGYSHLKRGKDSRN